MRVKIEQRLKKQSEGCTHSRHSGALTHCETRAQSAGRSVKFHVNSVGMSYALSIQITDISFPKSGASSSSISSSSSSSALTGTFPESANFFSGGGEMERESEEALEPLERVPRTAIVGLRLETNGT